MPLYLWLCRRTLRHDGYLHLYFHPWEFTDLSGFQIPWYVKRHSGEPLIKRLANLIGSLSEKTEFVTAHEFLVISKKSKIL